MYFECSKSVEDAERGTLYMVVLIMKRVPTLLTLRSRDHVVESTTKCQVKGQSAKNNYIVVIQHIYISIT